MSCITVRTESGVTFVLNNGTLAVIRIEADGTSEGWRQGKAEQGVTLGADSLVYLEAGSAWPTSRVIGLDWSETVPDCVPADHHTAGLATAV